MLITNLTTHAIDDVLEATFPASDPPAWTPGLARPAPQVTTPVRPDHQRTFAQSVGSLLGAGGIALLFPIAVLAVGAPVALALRGLLEAGRWLAAIVG